MSETRHVTAALVQSDWREAGSGGGGGVEWQRHSGVAIDYCCVHKGGKEIYTEK